MSALGRVVRSGVGRRRVQTVVIALASADGGDRGGPRRSALLVASNAPFDQAFAAQHGAHLTVLTDPAKATTAQLAATAGAAGVAAAAGPFAGRRSCAAATAPGSSEPPVGAHGPS